MQYSGVARKWWRERHRHTDAGALLDPGLGAQGFIAELAAHGASYAQGIVLMTGDPDSAEVAEVLRAAPVQVAAKPLGVQQIIGIMRTAEEREPQGK